MSFVPRSLAALVAAVLASSLLAACAPVRDDDTADDDDNDNGYSGCGGGGMEPIAALTLSPTTQVFGSFAVGDQSDAFAFTVTNTGEAGSQTGTLAASVTGDFTITDTTCLASLGAGETCLAHVAFAPTAEGARSGALTVVAGDTRGQAALSGSGVTDGAALLTINPSLADLGDVVVGGSSTAAVFTVSNDGDASAGALTTALGGADPSQFTVEDDTCTGASLAVGASCVVAVSFRPNTSGTKVATLTVDGASDPLTAALSGTALEGDSVLLVMTPTARDFGTVLLGEESAALELTVTNAGDLASGPLIELISGADANEFAITASTCAEAALAPNASCVVTVTFQPVGASGARAAMLTVDATPGGTVVASLTATAVSGGGFSMNPTGADFGPIAIGDASAPQDFTITNNGGSSGGPLTAIVSGADVARFAIVADACTGASLAAGASCVVSVRFEPVVQGDASAVLVVTGVNTAASALVGQGVAP